MREWKDRGIILRHGHFHENDLWLKALLARRGLQTLFAFGGAKSRRRFCGCLDQLNTLECTVRVSRTGEYLNLEEATLLASPVKLRTDWRGMGIAVNCARFTEACAITPENSGESFALLESLRERLERDSKMTGFFPLYYRLRLASAIGFAPSFTSCASCGKIINGQRYFLIEDGQTICAACAASGSGLSRKRHILLTGAAAGTLDSVQHTLPEDWNGAAGTDSDLRLAARVIDSFTQFHLGLEWDNGIFRRI